MNNNLNVQTYGLTFSKRFGRDQFLQKLHNNSVTRFILLEKVQTFVNYKKKKKNILIN